MKRLMFLLLLIPIYANAFDCGEHVKYGIKSTEGTIELCREGYALGYSKDKKIPEWVSYHITKDEVNKRIDRSNDFRIDKDIPLEFQALLSDYSGSGYDRGHMAPSATVDFTRNSMSESFLLTNMTPQLPEFNRYGWKKLEDYVRDIVNDRGELVVITGSICYKPYTTIGNGVTIPDYFYKIIFDPIRFETISFLVPHMKIKESQFELFLIDIDTIEKLTGIDFFNKLSNESSAEHILERNRTKKLW
jgi:endonuclease G